MTYLDPTPKRKRKQPSRVYDKELIEFRTLDDCIGVIRRIDNLCRFTVPREYMYYLGIEPNDFVEILCFKDGLYIKKFTELDVEDNTDE